MSARGEASSPAGGLERLPEAVRRRFWPHDEATLLAREHRPFLIARLLEEGDEDELRWLVSTVGRDALAAFVERRGARQLSQRSRAFWSTLLGVAAGDASSLAGEIWPLA